MLNIMKRIILLVAYLTWGKGSDDKATGESLVRRVSSAEYNSQR